MSYLIENLIGFCMPGVIHINELQSSVIPHLSLSLLASLHAISNDLPKFVHKFDFVKEGF